MNIFEQEVEQIREQSKIKEANFEEEIAILKEQVKDRECQTVTENIELIRLQQDKKNKTGQITTLKSQLQGLEENLNKLKVLNIWWINVSKFQIRNSERDNYSESSIF